MLCDSVSYYYLEFPVNCGAKSNENKTEIQKYGLANTVVMKLLNMGNDLYKKKPRTLYCKSNKGLHGECYPAHKWKNKLFVCSLFPKFGNS
jgi:hypothetical protein